MIPSKILRKIISQKRNLNLETYGWNKKFEQHIYNIQIKDSGKTYSLKNIYEAGCNIGNCLLTAKHISTVIDNSTICAGKVEILKGTKNSKSGDHVWVENEDSIIDPTLMIAIPKSDKIACYYHKEYSLGLLETNLELSYNDEFYFRKISPDMYYRGIYRVND